MKKEDIAAVAHLLSGIKDAIGEMEIAWKRNDAEQVNIAKKEILDFQRKISELL